MSQCAFRQTEINHFSVFPQPITAVTRMKVKAPLHRRWKHCSHLCSRVVVTLMVCTLCVMAFLTLTTLQDTFLHPLPALHPHRLTITSGRRELSDLNNLTVREQTKTLGHPDPMSLANRTVLSEDCFHGLLRSVDPTCDLGTFCTEAWRQEDVLCRVFLHQAALVPGPAQCDLPLGESKGTKVEEVKDTEAENEKHAEIIPRIAYYVLVSESCEDPFSFLFLHYLSVLSVQRYLRPYAIYVLGNCVPVGYWWSRVLSDVSTIRFVRRPRPWITKDGTVQWISHLADVIRLQVLLVNGGVYVDTDMILLQPLTPLLGYPLTMGLVDNITGMGNALILATRGARFLRDWYSGYRRFKPDHFHYNGMWEALRLWKEDPGSVHMESRAFYSPNWYEAHLLFGPSGFDLSASYAVHVWHRHATVPPSPEQFLTLNSTLGEVFRRIYFGH